MTLKRHTTKEISDEADRKLKQLKLADCCGRISVQDIDSEIDTESCIAYSQILPSTEYGATQKFKTEDHVSEYNKRNESRDSNCPICMGQLYFKSTLNIFPTCENSQPAITWFRCPICTDWVTLQVGIKQEYGTGVPSDAPEETIGRNFNSTYLDLGNASITTFAKLIKKTYPVDIAIQAAQRHPLFVEAEIFADRVTTQQVEFAQVAIAQNLSREAESHRKQEEFDLALAQVYQGCWEPCARTGKVAHAFWTHPSCQALFAESDVCRIGSDEAVFHFRANIYSWLRLAADCSRWWPNLPRNATTTYVYARTLPLRVSFYVLDSLLTQPVNLLRALLFASRLYEATLEDTRGELMLVPGQTLGPPKCITEAAQYLWPTENAIQQDQAIQNLCLEIAEGHTDSTTKQRLIDCIQRLCKIATVVVIEALDTEVETLDPDVNVREPELIYLDE